MKPPAWTKIISDLCPTYTKSWSCTSKLNASFGEWMFAYNYRHNIRGLFGLGSISEILKVPDTKFYKVPTVADWRSANALA